METEIFRAGTRYGAPTTSDEIKILICYILSRTGAFMSFEQIHTSLAENELVNYFELVSAVDSLLETGHISAETGGPEIYRVTALGEEAARTIKKHLPLSVREKAEKAANQLLCREKRERELVTEIRPSGGGFEVLLALPGDLGAGTQEVGGGNRLALASFTVFCPTREEADTVKRRFLNDPAYIYKGVLALLTGEKNVMGEMFPANENLF